MRLAAVIFTVVTLMTGTIYLILLHLEDSFNDYCLKFYRDVETPYGNCINLDKLDLVNYSTLIVDTPAQS